VVRAATELAAMATATAAEPGMAKQQI